MYKLLPFIVVLLLLRTIIMYLGGIVMFNLFFVVLVVVLVVVVIVLVKGNESLKTQHRDYVSAVSSVYDDHSNMIIGLQQQVEGAFDEASAFRNKAESLHKELFEKKAEIAGLAAEVDEKERRLNDLIFRNEALELRVKELCETSDELYQALKEATK